MDSFFKGVEGVAEKELAAKVSDQIKYKFWDSLNRRGIHIKRIPFLIINQTYNGIQNQNSWALNRVITISIALLRLTGI